MREFILDPLVQNKDLAASNEINHYIGQLKQELGAAFTPGVEKQFIVKAKKQPPQESLFKFAEVFLQQQKRNMFLKNHFEDRVTAKKSDFEKKRPKIAGITDGYITTKKTDSSGLQQFMTKTASFDIAGRDDYDNVCFVNEFIMAPLYKRTLYNRTPLIEGVKGVKSTEPNQTHFTSKFLPDFQTVAQFTQSLEDNLMGPQSANLKQVKGAEKVFAAALAWGEDDINAGNIGVMLAKNDIGENIFVLAKIDHGLSATNFSTNSSTALKNFAHKYQLYDYQDALPLNVNAFKKAVDGIIEISDEEIENFIKSRVTKLEKIGFDIKGLTFHFGENRAKTFNSFRELETHYIILCKQQMAIMREISERLDIISKISDVNDDWKNGEWLQDIKGEDPIAWAKQNKKKIEELPPEEWVKQQITKSLQAHGLRANPQLVLSPENIEALKKWCGKVPFCASNDIIIMGKIGTLQQHLHELESAQTTISQSHRREITLKILSILKSLITDNFFTKVIGNDTKKQVEAYEQKSKSNQAIQNIVKELATEEESFKSRR